MKRFDQLTHREVAQLGELPAGYIAITGGAVHIAHLRKYTSDHHRFMRCKPIVAELERLGQGSAEWRSRLNSMSDAEIDDVSDTMRELGQLHHALAEYLEHDTVVPDGVEPLFLVQRRPRLPPGPEDAA